MGITKVIISQGDTVHSLAQNYMGDYNLWEQIVILNDLDYPFIVPVDYEDFGEDMNVLRVGQTVMIPVNVGESSIIEDDILGDEGLGIDLLAQTNSVSSSLTSRIGGQLIAPNGDFALAIGIDSLRQDLINRLVTPKGSIPWHPNYGSDFLDLIGSKNTLESLDLAKLEVQAVFEADDRVEEVQDLVVNTYRDKLLIQAYVKISNGRTVEIAEEIGGVF